MNPIQLVSRRYLFSGKEVSLISTLTWLSITGVTIGTALLIVILSVFNGFYDVIRGILMNADPDIRIESAAGVPFLHDPQLESEILKLEEVRAVTPWLGGKSMLALQDGRNEVVRVVGIEPQSYQQVYPIEEHLRTGSFDLSVRSGLPGVVLSDPVRNRHRIRLEEEVSLLSTSGMRRALTQFSAPRMSRFQMRGSWSMQQIMEDEAVFIGLEAARRLFNERNGITGYDLRLADPEQADAVRAKLEFLGPEYRISTWYDLQKPLYDVMALEKWGAYFILMIIVLVAVLNIVGSLTMIVLQKQRDIGILMAMGMTRPDIRKLFRSQGLYIGLIGCGLGGSLGLLLTWLQHRYGLLKLSSAFIIDAYPVSVRPLDVAIILAGSMALCLAASWYPSRRATGTDPSEALRYE